MRVGAIALFSWGILACVSFGSLADADGTRTTLEPKCSAVNLGAECWKELAAKPGCHVWDSRHDPERAVDWSGQCAGAVIVGEGTLTWTSDRRSLEQTGTAENGKRHGRWVSHGANGEVAEGPYVDGRRHGPWVSRAADGFVMEGTFVDGEMQGHWIWRKADGSVTAGPVVDGKRHGYWVRRQTDGTVFEGSFAEGKKHGRWLMHNGAVGSCTFVEFNHGDEIDSWEPPTGACPSSGSAAN
ncbi:MAG: hypothetical protein OXH79_13205 [Boseongicola sp.]|nr:hypothetical protein [Boseongicola sp.]